MNEYFIYQHRYNAVKNSKEQKCVDWTERLKKHLQLPEDHLGGALRCFDKISPVFAARCVCNAYALRGIYVRPLRAAFMSKLLNISS